MYFHFDFNVIKGIGSKGFSLDLGYNLEQSTSPNFIISELRQKNKIKWSPHARITCKSSYLQSNEGDFQKKQPESWSWKIWENNFLLFKPRTYGIFSWYLNCLIYYPMFSPLWAFRFVCFVLFVCLTIHKRRKLAFILC